MSDPESPMRPGPTARVRRLRDWLAGLEVPAALVLDPQNVGYLSGFTGSTAALLVTGDEAVFITDSRYAIQARGECPGFRLVVIQSSAEYSSAIAAEAERAALSPIAFEADYVTVARHAALREKLPGIKLRPASGLVNRQVKDAEEIAAIWKACALADRGFEFAPGLLTPGRTEREVALELEHFLRKEGSEREPFETIVASGPRSALPHARASAAPLEPGFITLDFGARVDGYVSDITRTVLLGRADERQREVDGIVLEAQEAAIRAIRAGAGGRDVDAVARDRIAARGYGEHFGHGLGHGIGRVCHDHTALSPLSGLTLEAGMVVTVEPGIYVEGWGGVRIEDDVLVTADGCEVLTHAPKQLIELTF